MKYGVFAGRSAPALDALAGTDQRLGEQLREAAGSDRSGRASSGAVVHSAAADSAGLAPVSNTPAGQKASLMALRARVSQQQQVVAAYKARDARMAPLLRSMAYRRGSPLGASMPFSGASGGMSMPQTGGLSMPSLGGGLGGLSSLPGTLGGLAPTGRPATSLVSAVAPAARGSDIVTRAVGGLLPAGKAPEKGLQRYSILTNRAVSAAFPQIKDIGGVRADSLKWHPNGLALDIMIPHWNTTAGKAQGDAVLSFLMNHKEALGIDHAIWRQTIYHDLGPGGAAKRVGAGPPACRGR